MNSLAVPRRAKEAIGAITTLTHENGQKMTVNVEYNQLDPLLRATTYPEGDINDESGYSPFPGNINQLIFQLGPYVEKLEETQGVIAEFVNPKYKDETKNEFKSATRLECMMQDYLKCLPSDANSGFAVLDTWVGYSPTKNNPKDALSKYKVSINTFFDHKCSVRSYGSGYELCFRLELHHTQLQLEKMTSMFATRSSWRW